MFPHGWSLSPADEGGKQVRSIGSIAPARHAVHEARVWRAPRTRRFSCIFHRCILGNRGKFLHRGTREVPGPAVACSPAYRVNSAATGVGHAVRPGSALKE